MNSLITGASGLMAHQQKLDVVANNIANLNTTGYKSQTILFSDLIYTDLSQAIGASGTLNGGINPKQVGNGVQVAEISQNFSQGVLSDTGSEFDFAIEGDGFFVVGTDEQQYTRDGSFGVNSNGFLVDAATGGHVQRFGSVGETVGGAPGFQVAGDTRINIPLGASVAGKATESLDLIGNLPATATAALTEVLTSSSAFTVGGLAANATSLFNDLDFNLQDYISGDTLDVAGTSFDGASFSFSLPAGPTTTLGDFTTALNSNLVGATASLSSTGDLRIEADTPGDALLSMSIHDGSGNIGESEFESRSMIVETDGKDADIVESTLQLFDGRGQAHTVNVTYEKADTNRWDARFSSADGSVDFLDNEVVGIVFDERGAFEVVNGSGTGDSDIELTVSSLSGTQEILVDLNSLTHLATNFASTYDQDGFSPGKIVGLEVAADGTLSGVASNGRRLEIAQMAIAEFSNTHGLQNVGQNYFQQTASSGDPSIGAGNTSGRGRIRGGSLESSNVDVALEFTQLIIAQRGFSANARSITVATEVLQELNNIF